jgi:hypothetical protein
VILRPKGYDTVNVSHALPERLSQEHVTYFRSTDWEHFPAVSQLATISTGQP